MLAYAVITGVAATFPLLSCGGDDASTISPPLPDYAIEKIGGDEQSAPVASELTEPMVVRVSRSGEPAPGRPVGWEVVEGYAVLGMSDSVSGADGLARARLALGETAGRVVVRASVTAGGSVDFISTALPGPPARLILSPGFAALAAGQARQPAVQVRDAFGNEIPDVEVVLESRSSGIVSASEGTVRGLERGTAVVVATAGDAADSAAYAVLDAGEVAVAFVDVEGRAFAEADPDTEVELRLVALHPGGADLAALQGRLGWTGGATYASDRPPTVGFSWAANPAEAATRLLRFAAWSPESADGGTVLGVAVFRSPVEPGASVFSVTVESAGDESGREATGRVVLVSTAITVGGLENP